MQFECDIDRFIVDVFKNGEYRLLFHYPTVLDIGCNVGAFSLWIKDLADEIYAIDIAQPNIDNLKKTLENNKITTIKPFCCAIGGGTVISSVRMDGTAGSGAWRLEQSNDAQIQTYSLNDFMEKEHIAYADLVKIDVEGGETEIIEAPDFPYKKIGTILGETHAQRWGGVKVRLQRYGFKWWGNEQYFIGRKV